MKGKKETEKNHNMQEIKHEMVCNTASIFWVSLRIQRRSYIPQ